MEMQEKSNQNPYYQCYDNKTIEKSQPDLSSQNPDETHNSNHSTLVAQSPRNGSEEQIVVRPTSYVETLIHIFKGNVGPG